MSASVPYFIYSVIILVLYILHIIALWANRYRPSIKSRSPLLVVLSIIGNMVYTLAITHSFIAFTLNQQTQAIAYFNLIVSWFFYPMFVFPYFLRPVKLYMIFNVDVSQINMNENADENKIQKIKKKFKLMNAHYFAKITLYVVIAVLLMVVIIFSLFLNNSSYGSYLFFDLQLKDYTITPNEYMSTHKYALILGDFIVFVEEIFFFFLYLIIRNVNNDFNIKGEMISTFIVWELCSVVSGIIQLFACNCEKSLGIELTLYLILVFKNFSCLFASATLPLINLLKKRVSFVPYGETAECCLTLQTTLTTKAACVAFYKYISSIDTAKHYMLLFMSIKEYEILYSEYNANTIKFAQNMLQQFILPGGPFTIKEAEPIQQKYLIYNSDDKCEYNELFRKLKWLCFSQLSIYFDEFKQSSQYGELQKKLQHREIIYELLTKAGLT
jgi:hypothetical protein